MNCLSHAYRYLDDPYFAAGACLPDWLGMIDRKVRIRRKDLWKPASEGNAIDRSVATGIAQHLDDDDRFHNNPEFVRVCNDVSERLAPFAENRSHHFVGFASHILVELLLDASIETDQPGTLDRYYHTIADVCVLTFETCVNRLTNRSSHSIPEFLDRYLKSRFMFDYLEDDRLLTRLNGVLMRVGFEPLPAAAIPELSHSRSFVFENRYRLLPLGSEKGTPAG